MNLTTRLSLCSPKLWVSLATCIAFLGGVLALGADRAHAVFAHEWSCNSASYIQCYDNEEQQYVPWFQVYARMSASSREVCAKAITAANNVRASTCNYYTTKALTCYSYNYPESWAYIYWGDPNGTIRNIDGRASTASCD